MARVLLGAQRKKLERSRIEEIINGKAHGFNLLDQPEQISTAWNDLPACLPNKA